jgi:hypothetical protein
VALKKCCLQHALAFVCKLENKGKPTEPMVEGWKVQSMIMAATFELLSTSTHDYRENN